MKKKLVAVFTSLLLVIIACVSLVACGDKNDNPDTGDDSDDSLVGNWIYEGAVKDDDLFLAISAANTSDKYNASQYSIEAGKVKDTTKHFSFQTNEVSFQIDSDKSQIIFVDSVAYTRTTQTLGEWSTTHNAYLKLAESAWLSDDTHLQGYASVAKAESGANRGFYVMELTYYAPMWGSLKKESHSLVSQGLTKNTYKWGNYTLTMVTDNTFTLAYQDEFYTFTCTNQTLEEWKTSHAFS